MVVTPSGIVTDTNPFAAWKARALITVKSDGRMTVSIFELPPKAEVAEVVLPSGVLLSANSAPDKSKVFTAVNVDLIAWQSANVKLAVPVTTTVVISDAGVDPSSVEISVAMSPSVVCTTFNV
ncbi:hypothetical protein SDC9_200201 [bioreactor metagenome]|uniref:Uncharacterized protein n=1 Tax=bioreactor metagenome TaxID=1076179 RepID=A0A645IQD3_9ZZZZ